MGPPEAVRLPAAAVAVARLEVLDHRLAGPLEVVDRPLDRGRVVPRSSPG